MNRILSIVLYIAIAVSLVACGDDDDVKREVEWPKEINDSKVFTKEFLVSSGAGFKIPIEIDLADFNKLNNLNNEIIGAEINAASFIDFKGVSAGNHILKNVTLKIKDTNYERKFNDIDSDLKFQSIKTDLNFLDHAASRLASHKKCTLILEGTSEKKIVEDVVLSINLDILFQMRQ